MKNKIDIHSHIAWDIDDGMPTIIEAKEALEMAKKENIVGICSTPHVVPGQTDQDALNHIFQRQLECIDLAKQYGIYVYSGAEMFMNHDFIEWLDRGLYQTLNESRYMLAEFDVRRDYKSHTDPEECLYEIEVRDMVPVVAHAERYFHKGLDLDVVRHWHDQGYVIQVNRTSLLGLHGKIIKRNAWTLLEQGLAHCIATDTHRALGSRIETLDDVYNQVESKFSKETAELLFFKNPLAILSDAGIVNMERNESKWQRRRAR